VKSISAVPVSADPNAIAITAEPFEQFGFAVSHVFVPALFARETWITDVD